MYLPVNHSGNVLTDGEHKLTGGPEHENLVFKSEKHMIIAVFFLVKDFQSFRYLMLLASMRLIYSRGLPTDSIRSLTVFVYVNFVIGHLITDC